MKTTDNITVTDGRLNRALSTRVEPIIMPKVTKKITQAVNQSKFQLGTMTKFYPYLDKCEVELNNELVICSILHRFGGELIDFYTPLGEEDFCDNLNEPCIIPRNGLGCLVLDIDNGTDEKIMCGFINLEELIGINPASPGNIKLVTRGGNNQYWLKFGNDGLDIRTINAPTTNIGDYDEDMSEVNYADSNETYTKEEIDKIIEDLRKEIHGDDENAEGE